MPVTTDLFRRTYQYRACELRDIPDHFAKIAEWIPEAEHIEFQERMEDCIEEGTAFCTENTFLYYKKTGERRMAVGVAMFGMGHIAELFALFIGIFTKFDQETYFMRFKLHPGKTVQEYLGFVTKISVKRMYQDPDHPLMIRVDRFRRLTNDIIQKQGLKG